MYPVNTIGDHFKSQMCGLQGSNIYTTNLTHRFWLRSKSGIYLSQAEKNYFVYLEFNNDAEKSILS